MPEPSSPSTRRTWSNAEIAAVLERAADLLEVQHAKPFRVRAYRTAAEVVRHHASPVAQLAVEEGIEGLDALPSIGKSLASSIVELVATGHLSMLDRLEGEVSPEDLLRTVPGIGDEFAARIHRQLGVETLEDLELAAHDGRLATVYGFSHRRIQGVRDTLATLLTRASRRRSAVFASQDARLPDAEPDVATLLAVDDEYRRAAVENRLKKIAPRRFNPRGEAWLPILHTERGGWHFTALFSNTARAHELGTTGDWVVLYFEKDGHERQCTVVTARRGALAGRRVVRGREEACERYYGLVAPNVLPSAAEEARP